MRGTSSVPAFRICFTVPREMPRARAMARVPWPASRSRSTAVRVVWSSMQLLLPERVEQHLEIGTRLAGEPSRDPAARRGQATCRALAQPALRAPSHGPQHLEVLDERFRGRRRLTRGLLLNAHKQLRVGEDT